MKALTYHGPGKRSWEDVPDPTIDDDRDAIVRGVHGKPAPLHLQDLWIRKITITTGLVDTYSTPTLLRMVASGQLDASAMVTHHFGLQDMMHAYDLFSSPAETEALKVMLTR